MQWRGSRGQNEFCYACSFPQKVRMLVFTTSNAISSRLKNQDLPYLTLFLTAHTTFDVWQ